MGATQDPGFSLESYLAQGFLAEHGYAPVEVVIWSDVDALSPDQR